VLGLWIAQTEGAKFWLQVVTELKNRGVADIFIACVNGLKGFPEAIEAVYPQAAVQLCIRQRTLSFTCGEIHLVVHMVRNRLNYVGWNKRDIVAADMKRVHTAATEDEAAQYLTEFEAKWDDAYPPISQSWRNN
jgi:putative transposase